MFIVSLAASAWLLIAAGMISATVAYWQMIHKANSALPGKRVSGVWLAWWNIGSVKRSYKAAFPAGNLDQIYHLALIAMLVGTLVFAACVALLSRPY